MTNMATQQETPVRRSVTVKAPVERAFEVFTAGLDTWWPRTHHIGSAPMKAAVLEGRVGGRCYSEQVDGTQCPWGTVLAWEPPHRFVMAWQITPEWKYQPDLSQSSEVEVRFTPLDDGTTRVDLEHRNFERHGAGGASMRQTVGGEGGWGGLLALFAARAERTE
ncbi:MAG: SRPBCC family protein [Acidobacteriota bacterium]|nr:SRPBCC family protein [Acidobacteriota bacterium]